uniref:Uncharacterized protein n=1 Tax=Ditylenchus dipsaci TaxID=166011 RepID=A0A915EF23_9BILA
MSSTTRRNLACASFKNTAVLQQVCMDWLCGVNPKQAFIMQGHQSMTIRLLSCADSKVYNVQSQELLKNYNDINFGVGFEKNAQIAINFLNKRGDGTKASRCSIILQYKIKQIARLANKKNKACLFLVNEQVPLNYIDQSKPLPKNFFVA